MQLCKPRPASAFRHVYLLLCLPRRYNYVTPTSYLELLTTFIKLLSEKRNEISERRRRLESGLDKLLSTAAQVRSALAASLKPLPSVHAVQVPSA